MERFERIDELDHNGRRCERVVHDFAATELNDGVLFGT
jgi:hypothetical protein